MAVERRTLGNEHHRTLQTIGSLAKIHLRLGDHVAAGSLMEEALAGLRRTLGAEHEDTLKAMGDLAHYYGGTMEERQNGSTRTFQVAMCRQLNEEVAETMRRSSPGHGPTTINAMMANSNLGANLAGIGDIERDLL